MRILRHFTVIMAAVSCWLSATPPIVSGQSTTLDQNILRYQRLLQRNSRDASAYYRLGDVYIQKARESGDLSYMQLAEKALQTCLEIAPEHSGAARHLAYALYMRHAFAEATVQAKRAVTLDPTDSHAHGILGDAYLEVGRYDEAALAYRRMVELHGDLYAYSRLAGLKSLGGDVDGATADLERAIALGRAQERPRESLAWAMWQLGNEHLALGRLAAAEVRYQEALQTFPGYYRALAGLAQVRTAEQRFPEAIDLYHKALAVIPLPEYAAALGDVYTKIGNGEEARKQYDLVEYIGHLSTVNLVLYNRELAYFYADHDRELVSALDLAQREIEVRKDVYAYDVLAWALYKNDQPEAALAAMTEALKLGTRDARLFFHAGMIHYRLGDMGAAQSYLRRALTTNPFFHPLHAAVAGQTLAALENANGSATTRGPADER